MDGGEENGRGGMRVEKKGSCEDEKRDRGGSLREGRNEERVGKENWRVETDLTYSSFANLKL